MTNNKVSITNKGSNVSILYNTISGGSSGIINSGGAVTVGGNSIKSVKSCGIYSSGSKDKITSNTLVGVKTGYGVYFVKNTKSGLVQGNKISTFSYAIVDVGISDVIKSNVLSSNGVGVKVLSTAKTVQVSSNTITGGTNGIVNQASSISINGNTIKSVKTYSIYNAGSKNKITSNKLTGLNTGYGIYSTKNAKSNTIQSNTITKFAYGIKDAGASDTIKSNTLTSNKIGINILNSAKNIQVTSNKISKSTSYGIYNKGINTNINKNQVTSNKYGIITIKSVKNTNNTMKGNKVNTTIIK